ncbi:MAG TPA: restriction endonuclease subunit S [Bellilinea sp.]|nr:restriction endonuclease subunit S [Bellilinea sp.]
MDNISNQATLPNTSAYDERRQEFIKLGWWVSIPLSIVPSHWIYDGEQRLDGGYYAAEVTSAFRAVYESGLEIKKISDVTKTINYPTRFKRIYTKSKQNGVPFLTASEMLQFRPESNEFLSTNLVKSASCIVPKGVILVTRSGSLGRSVIVGERLHQFAITDDAFRVEPEGIEAGYLYAYLSSWIGQALIVKDKYGATIKHLEPNHIARLPIPILPRGAQITIHNQIIHAYELREKANSLLDEATDLLYSSLGLQPYPLSEVPYLPPPPDKQPSTRYISHPQAFTVNSASLNNRFDASYHVPTVRLAIDMISKLTHPFAPLGSLVKDIYLPNRFKRIYVQKEYGIPFLQGSHLSQNILYDLKYVSSKANEKNIQQCVIHTGDILVSRSGTIGVISLVSQLRDGWVGTEDLLRIIPDEAMANRGYIALFLTTKYGQYQIKSKTYGGVVDHITVEDLKEVIIPNPPLEIQNEIGKLVIEAFELKDFATKMEMETVNGLENLLAPKPIIS